MLSRVISKNSKILPPFTLCFFVITACQTAPNTTTTDTTPTQVPVEAISTENLIQDCPKLEPAKIPVCPPVKKWRCPVCPTAKLGDKLVVGEIEKVTLSPQGFNYTARIDSGAASTSIHATRIGVFERDGKRWVRFNITNPGGEPVTLEKEVLRRIRIRQVELSSFERRYVVMMTLTLGSITEQVEVSLTDRSGMEYPVLVGRNFLRDNALVDVSQALIAK